MSLPDHLTLEVAVPERLLVRETVKQVQIPGEGGYFGVLPGHAPLMSKLGIGVLSFSNGSKMRYMSVHGGVVEVLPDHVRVLADAAEWAEDIDIERAETARRRANDLLGGHNMEIDVDRTLQAVARAQARLEATRRLKSA